MYTHGAFCIGKLKILFTFIEQYYSPVIVTIMIMAILMDGCIIIYSFSHKISAVDDIHNYRLNTFPVNEKKLHKYKKPQLYLKQ